jgi:predicted HicB family RNase H-like nuclease
LELSFSLSLFVILFITTTQEVMKMENKRWDKQICFRMEEEFHKMMMELAKYEGTGRSNWIRKTLKKAIRKEHSAMRREASMK